MMDDLDYYDPGRWSRAERQMLRERLDALVSRAVAAGHPAEGLKAAVAEVRDDLAQQPGLCHDLIEWLDYQGFGTVADRLYRAGALDD